MLEIRNLTAGYSGQTVLNYVNLDIPEGKVTVLAGPNGCGKTTLLKALVGVLPAEKELYLSGQPLHSLPAKDLAKKIAYLPQNRPVPEITVQNLVLHGRFPYLRYPRRYRPEDLCIAQEAMERLGIADLADRNLPTLSGGQRQKVYLAMALAQDTDVVLLDEPTTFLDIAHQIQMMELARFLSAQGKTVVLVLHDLAMALEYADHLVVLSGGSVAVQGDAEHVFSSGVLNTVFRVKVSRVMTDDGWKYYYG